MKNFFYILFLFQTFSLFSYDTKKIAKAIVDGQIGKTWNEFSYKEISYEDEKNVIYQLTFNNLPPGAKFEIFSIGLKIIDLPPQPIITGYIDKNGKSICNVDSSTIEEQRFIINAKVAGDPVYYVLISKELNYYRAVAIVDKKLETCLDQKVTISAEYFSPEKTSLLIKAKNLPSNERLKIISKMLNKTWDCETNENGELLCVIKARNNIFINDHLILNKNNQEILGLDVVWGSVDNLPQTQIFKDAFTNCLFEESSLKVNHVDPGEYYKVMGHKLSKNKGIVGIFCSNLQKGILSEGTNFDLYSANLSFRDPEHLCSGYVNSDGEAYSCIPPSKLSQIYTVVGIVSDGEPIFFYLLTRDHKKLFLNYIVPKEISIRGHKNEKISLVYLDASKTTYLIKGENFKPHQRIQLLIKDNQNGTYDTAASSSGSFTQLFQETNVIDKNRILEVKIEGDKPLKLKYKVGC